MWAAGRTTVRQVAEFQVEDRAMDDTAKTSIVRVDFLQDMTPMQEELF